MFDSHPHQPGARPRPGTRETIALLAGLMAMNAFAIDAMVPALPDIGAHLGVVEENRRQLVIVAYTFGFGLGQLLWGPLADRFGRKPILVAGVGAYVGFAFFCSFAPSFTALIAGRLLMGASAASTRVLVVAMVRDLFEGEAMARVMSLIFMVFMLVPVLAPSVGQAILLAGPWQAIFWLLGIYGLLIGLWGFLRLPETLHPEYRRTLQIGELAQAARAVLTERQSLGYTIAQTAIFTGLIAYISSIQQIVFDAFKEPQMIGLVFGAVAAPMALASWLNSRLVGRFGLRRVGHSGAAAFATLTLAHAVFATAVGENLLVFALLQSLVMASFAFCSANLNTLAMQNMAAIAGMASSIQGVIGTIFAAIGGFAIGQAFDGTQLPFLWGLSLAGAIGLGLIVATEPRRMFERRGPARGQAPFRPAQPAE
ncbi:multidrug effflux MFS transporter [Sphingomonas astaxanthinifaciens]|uniref:Bcr/CflA family drug resistance efflux transporter n=1 Tax=Sphingomonas astaxanthinifaciens DSM 22298 TaxID=1123267 RepID=A0ABQ5Z2P0_9SPHN|nr:multidrug effflux MFS transporter [Sphingomonas astaxanthinifaciens]GLR47039.1 Bcr/CflA family drug resistance efflux transporter [Sphingomonas astaxanthinifaciens DSM 22298]